ncbi:MAG: cellulase-like family protein, partial [Acidobacteriaceae bacterium]
MDRRNFLGGAAAAVIAGSVAEALPLAAAKVAGVKHPRAITMWEFSWIERRWPGAGYEDWDRALD